MKVFVFDTETSGLPDTGNPSIYKTFSWPYIIQLSYIIYDSDTNHIWALEDDYINIDLALHMSAESVEIHKITREQLDKGISIVEALEKFNNYAKQCDVMVAHNVSFDKRMIMVEGVRNKIKMNIHNTYCTMKNSADICKIERTWDNGDKYFKYPKLSELYYELFKMIPKNTHNALIDILLCMRCYCKIELNIDISSINRTIRLMLKETH